jgi:DNA topoisomerase-3
MAYKQVFLCEKHKQALILKDIFKANNKKNSNGYVVSYSNKDVCILMLSGHIMELQPPEFYEPSLKNGWNIEALPVIPNGIFYPTRVKQDKKSKAILNEIKRVLVDEGIPDEFILSTDHDREGEVLGREVLLNLNVVNKLKKTTRMVYSEINKEPMLRSYEQRKPLSDFDRLFFSGIARLNSDWLIGMTVTMGLTVRNAKFLPPRFPLNSGRVIFFLIYVLAKRQEEIDGFVPRKYYNEKVFFSEKGMKFHGKVVIPPDLLDKTHGQLLSKDEIEKIHQVVSSKKSGTVSLVKKKLTKSRCPLGFDSTTLKNKVARQTNMSLEEITNIMQVLYSEKGLLSYPRTDVCYLPETKRAEMISIIKNNFKIILPLLSKSEQLVYRDIAKKIDFNQKSKIWKKGTEEEAHHAIVVTSSTNGIQNLSPKELLVYKTVFDNIIQQFLPDYEYETTKYTIDVGGYDVNVSGKVDVNLGWKAIERNEVTDDENTEDEGNSALPPLNKGDNVVVEGAEMLSQITVKPKNYTDVELATIMKSPNRFVNNKELLKKIKNLTIGTESTRTEHIKSLETKGFVTKKKDGKKVRFYPTPKLMALYKIAPRYFKYPEVSAYWEENFRLIEKGGLELSVFMDKQKNFLTRFVEELKAGNYDLKEPFMEHKPCPTENCEGFVFLSKAKSGFEYYACGICNNAFFNNDGEVGGVMQKK